ncbi:hypothetical protein AGMMS50262_23990 [Bacteroidia bacterium]|nr:hypothetical protein AGMMS50262_23990 [Bacteroidia bacterium]
MLSIGLKVFTDMRYAKALIISGLFWLITILIPVIAVYVSQLTIERSGVI